MPSRILLLHYADGARVARAPADAEATQDILFGTCERVLPLNGLTERDRNESKAAVAAYCKGHDFIDAAERAKQVATLSSDAITLYDNAARRPVDIHAALVERAVDKVQRSPQSYRSMVLEKATKKREGVYVRLDDPTTHNKVRMALYDIVRRELEYTIPERIPLTVVVDSVIIRLIKVCFPGSDAAQFTWFKPSDSALLSGKKRAREESETQ